LLQLGFHCLDCLGVGFEPETELLAELGVLLQSLLQLLLGLDILVDLGLKTLHFLLVVSNPDLFLHFVFHNGDVLGRERQLRFKLRVKGVFVLFHCLLDHDREGFDKAFNLLLDLEGTLLRGFCEKVALLLALNEGPVRPFWVEAH
jgi:hypothetical protein